VAESEHGEGGLETGNGSVADGTQDEEVHLGAARPEASEDWTKSSMHLL